MKRLQATIAAACRIPAVIGFVASIAPCLSAQPAATTGDETLTLSPFAVTTKRVHGYQATDSITATGIGTKIRDVPTNIAVLTPELISDRGVDDIRWIANTISGVNTNTREFTQINVRGFAAPIQQDGFDEIFETMEDVERVEIIKGPSAVFFGTNLPGGMVNVVKGKPEFRAQSYVSARYASYDSYRTTLMGTGPLLKNRLAYRLYYSRRDEGGAIDFTKDAVENLRGALTWRPLEQVSLRGYAEYTDVNRVRSHGYPVGHPAYIAAARAGQVVPGTLQRTWLDQNPLYGTREPLGQISMYRLALPDVDFNTQGPDSGIRSRTFNFGLIGEVKLSRDLDVSFGVNQSANDSESTEWNSFRPVAGVVPGTFAYPATAALFNQNAKDSQGIKTRVAYRPSFWGTNHVIVAGADDFWSRTAQRNYQGAPRTFNAFTDPIRLLKAEVRAANPGGLVAPEASTAVKAKTRGYFVTDQISLWQNKVRLMVGARQTQTRNAAGQEREKTTPQYAVMYTPVPFASVFANVSETFQPNYILDAFGKEVGPTLGKGKEAGIKVGSEDQRFSATVSVYENSRSNVAQRDFPLEALLNVRPLYALGGLERNRGFELDLHLAPLNNYQIVGSYTYSWEHKTIASTGEVRQVGVDLVNTPDHVFNLWNKYTFTTGAPKGIFVGGGARFATSEKLHPSWDVTVRSGGYVKLDAVIGYERKVNRGRFSTQLNLNNLTNQREFVGSYILSDPLTFSWSVRWDF